MIIESQTKIEEAWKVQIEGENYCVVHIPLLNFLILENLFFQH